MQIKRLVKGSMTVLALSISSMPLQAASVQYMEGKCGLDSTRQATCEIVLEIKEAAQRPAFLDNTCNAESAQSHAACGVFIPSPSAAVKNAPSLTMAFSQDAGK